MKTVIKKELGLHILYDYLDSVKYACSGALSMDEKMNALFSELYERCGNLVCAELCGDITEQYVVTVCEED